ncbi:glycosyltransferase family 39 protein [Candidatus Saganbacteria bacterium]|nr:glycosyltransferase family 39 protein [Candidatus Saganbacteria bacterium]
MKKTIIFLLLILSLHVALRIPFLNVPLERDEGAYGYVAQRILAGDAMYKDAVDHKPPLIYFIYASFIKLFGSSILAIRLPTLLYSLLTTLAIFLVGRLWVSESLGTLAAFLYALFSGGPLIQGSTSNTETFMVLPLVLAVLFFLKYKRKENLWLLFISGLFSGIAILIKQGAILNFFVLFCFIFILNDNDYHYQNVHFNIKNIKRAFLLLSGFLVFPILVAIFLFLSSNLKDAIFCNIFLNKEYAASFRGGLIANLSYGFQALRSQMELENGPLWLLSIASIFFIVKKDRSHTNNLVLFWLIVPFIGVFLTGRYFGHYFIHFMPGLCLLSAYSILKIKENINYYSKAAILVILLFLSINIAAFQYPFYLKYSKDEISTSEYRSREFVASFYAAEELKKSLKPGDNILVWSANPEIYFYLGKKSPTKYFNYLPWMQKAERDDEILKNIINSKPDYIVREPFSAPNKALDGLLSKIYSPYMRVDNVLVYKL